MKADRKEAESRYDSTIRELEAYGKTVAPQSRDDDVLKANEILGVAQYVLQQMLRVLRGYNDPRITMNYARKYFR